MCSINGRWIGNDWLILFNNAALVNALKTLQLKIERLERDRVEADDHFKHVSEETVRNHDDFTSSDEENTHPSMSHPPDTSMYSYNYYII